MNNDLQLNTIKQGVWVDTEQTILKEKLASFFLLPEAPQPAIRITNHLVNRMALIAGLSSTIPRQEKIHYQSLTIDWDNKVELSKVVNYEMERGVAYLLEGKHLKQLFNH